MTQANEHPSGHTVDTDREGAVPVASRPKWFLRSRSTAADFIHP